MTPEQIQKMAAGLPPSCIGKDYEEVITHLAKQHIALQQQVNALAAEGAMMRQIIDSVTDLDNEPQYHEEGMGCGLEDRNITDRYEAMGYGWDQAMERVYGEVIPCANELDFSATDAAIREIRNAVIDDAINAMVTSGAQLFGDCVIAVNQLRAGEQGGDHV